ncbi:MAG: hypothetical protein Q8P21_00580 [bacterium]|nr:hypothetical protein [bacterium]
MSRSRSRSMSEKASSALHHANLLIGSPEETEVYLRTLCAETLGIKLQNNPDFFAFRSDTFGIDEARELKLLSTRKALTSVVSGQAGRKIFFITSMRLTGEAQNALLKTFEDPSPGTHFFLSVREESLIVPTLLSRMQTIRVSTRSTPISNDAEKFISLTIKERLMFAKKFADAEKSLPDFLDDLLLELRKRVGQAGNGLSIENVYKIRRFAHGSAALPRLVIEHLALVL